MSTQARITGARSRRRARTTAEGSDGGVFRLNIANALWGQTSFPFAEPFLDTLAINYGDFASTYGVSSGPDWRVELRKP